MSTDTESDLRARVDELEHAVRRLRRQVRSQALVNVRALAKQENRYPDSYSGIIKLMARRGVPRRLASGAKKPDGSKAQTYVSLSELESGEELGTQSVQRDGGLIE